MANWRLLHTLLLQAQSDQKAHLSFYVYMHHFRVLLNAYVLFFSSNQKHQSGPCRPGPSCEVFRILSVADRCS